MNVIVYVLLTDEAKFACGRADTTVKDDTVVRGAKFRPENVRPKIPEIGAAVKSTG